MPKMTIRGGSSAEPERGFKSPFFHTNVKAIELRAKETYRFRILPAFVDDLDMSDPKFRTSYISYRDANCDKDVLTRTEGFTSWYYILSGYSFLGRLQKGFLSPSNEYSGRPAGGIDPIVDCRNFARTHSDPAIKALTERPKTGMGQAVIPDLRRWAFFNGYIEREEGWQNAILYMTQMGMDDLKQKLSIKGGRNDQIVTEAWPDYLYGDVTDPMTGLIATARKGRPNNNTQGLEATCLFFSKKPSSLEGIEMMPIDPSTESGQAILAGRYAIGDKENVMQLPSYTQMLAYLVEDGTIPYSVIQEACGHFTDVPAEPAHAREASYSTPPAVDEVDAPPGAGVPTNNGHAATQTRTVAAPAARTVAAPAGRTTVAPPQRTTVAPPATTKPQVAATARSHAALNGSTTVKTATPTEEGQARYDELVTKLTACPTSLTSAEMQEVAQLSMIYREVSAAAA